jgi:hypothetical protein
MTRAGLEIREAARELRASAVFGRANKLTGALMDQDDISDRVAEALEWAAGSENEFGELIENLKEIGRKK